MKEIYICSCKKLNNFMIKNNYDVTKKETWEEVIADNYCIHIYVSKDKPSYICRRKCLPGLKTCYRHTPKELIYCNYKGCRRRIIKNDVYCNYHITMYLKELPFFNFDIKDIQYNSLILNKYNKNKKINETAKKMDGSLKINKINMIKNNTKIYKNVIIYKFIIIEYNYGYKSNDIQGSIIPYFNIDKYFYDIYIFIYKPLVDKNVVTITKNNVKKEITNDNIMIDMLNNKIQIYKEQIEELENKINNYNVRQIPEMVDMVNNDEKINIIDINIFKELTYAVELYDNLFIEINSNKSTSYKIDRIKKIFNENIENLMVKIKSTLIYLNIIKETKFSSILYDDTKIIKTIYKKEDDKDYSKLKYMNLELIKDNKSLKDVILNMVPSFLSYIKIFIDIIEFDNEDINNITNIFTKEFMLNISKYVNMINVEHNYDNIQLFNTLLFDVYGIK